MNQQIVHILLVDDDEDDYFLTSELLNDIERRQFQLEWADTFEAAQVKIGERRHDVYLIDYRLGPRNGLELLRWGIDQGCQAPFILLTGQGDHEVDMEAMQAGAADYLVKGRMDAPLLERSIRYALERKRSKDRRAELENQLRQMQKMEAIGQMAGGIAHDFNNILTAIVSYAGVAKRTLNPDHRAQRHISGIEKSVQRASNLTRQLLAFARRQIIEPEILDLNDLVLNLEQLLRRLINENIELVTLTDSAIDLVRADPGQLEQVLVNLIVNARDAMPNGGQLIIETAPVTLDDLYAQDHVEVVPGDYVLLAISDDGEGMSDEVKAHIFEPFFTTKESGKGTGLGLATCYGIVRQSDGFIWVYSEVGRGTTFKIYLPAVKQDVITSARAVETAVLPSGNEIILLVEDDAVVRELAANALRQQGYMVMAAANGEDALHRIDANPDRQVDLLVSDVVMPRMGGAELIEQLQRRQPSVKVLFISGYPDNTVVHKRLLEGDFAFLQKPFTPDMLVYKVREVLDG